VESTYRGILYGCTSYIVHVHVHVDPIQPFVQYVYDDYICTCTMVGYY
jgi:hypothetical protein